MPEQAITITIPEKHEDREEILSYLATKGLVSPQSALEHGIPKKSPAQKRELLRHYREEPSLTGLGETLDRMRKDFREDFQL